ncbi:MAG TPA: hemolysin III family protein [Mycobacteriales bacterium]|nr:hemolysin III family protein [Mycobacteriales bacterium]
MKDKLEERVADIAAALKPRLRGVLHEVAFALSLVSGTALICLADPGRPRFAAIVYASSVVLLFGTSAAYHRGQWSPRAHALMRRLDHSMIFILIAGTYTPFGLLLLEGRERWVVLVGVWTTALIGILVGNTLRQPPRWLSVALYVAMGWAAVGIIPDLIRRGEITVGVLLLVGGLLYTAGGIVYALRRPDPSPRWFGFHEVFHALTVVAFAVHYVAVSVATYRTPT